MDRAIFLCLLLVAALKGIESVSVEEDLTLTLSQKQALDKVNSCFTVKFA